MFSHLKLYKKKITILFSSMVFHLNCPVTSDIVEGDGLSNAEANKENIRLEIEILSVGISGNSL